MTLTRVSALVAIAITTAACAGSHAARSRPAEASVVSANTVSSSRLILGGRVRCTATATTPVQAGLELGVRFALHNVSRRPVKVRPGSWLVVRSASGTTYDTRLPDRGFPGGPLRLSTALPAGATRTIQAPVIPVRWRGPLRITPGCEQSALPVLRVGVEAPGPPPDDRTAVADVVSAVHPLLDRCWPSTDGVAVEGQIDAPSRSAPSLLAKCSVSIEREGDFLVAQVLVLSPPDLRGVHIWRTYEQPLVPRETAPPYEAIVWQFVVTKDGARSVGGATRDATKGGVDRMAPSWPLTGAYAWQGRPSTSRCGYQGFYGSPSVDFISVCPA